MLKPVPVRLQKRITEMGGKADNGFPLFRIVRGCDRFTHIGGKWNDFDKNSGALIRSVVEVRHVPKYPEAMERYIFEALCPPENYGTEREWNQMFTEWIDGQRIETLGPYPREGEYELVKVLETPTTRQFVPLTDTICDALVTTAKLNKELPARIKYEAAQERRKREEEAKEQRMIDKINDLAPADFTTKPYIIHPGLKQEKKTPGGIYLP